MKKDIYVSPIGEIVMITLVNKEGCSVRLCSVGAAVASMMVPDRDGKLADVAIGYENAADYVGDGPASGKIPGRYANRIANGRFSLDGREYRLPVNLPPNCNHGGNEGFHNRNWKVKEADDSHVVFTYRSVDGEAGFPGNLDVEAEYRWTDANELKLTLRATTDAHTVVSLTNHTYWNLGGHDSGSILRHRLQLAASRYLPTDSTLIPTGILEEVAGTPMDFLLPKEIGRDIHEDFAALNYGKGYDACWVVDGYEDKCMKKVAVLSDAVSGRVLEIESDQPGVQVYTGNWLSDSPMGKGNHHYEDYEGVAIECQSFPDSPNKPSFPSTELNPGEEYLRHINFIFR